MSDIEIAHCASHPYPNLGEIQTVDYLRNCLSDGSVLVNYYLPMHLARWRLTWW
jgi:hypothetical protein